MENLWHDLRYGVRMMFKNRGFTVVAVVTLALGIGANTAIFSVVNAVLLRPLPYEDSNRLVWFWENQPDFRHGNLSPADFLDYQAQSVAFEEIAAYRQMDFTLTSDRQPEQIRGLIVSANYFSLLGIQPEVGRAFQPEDGRAGAPRVAVVSNGFWQRRFGGDPNLIGKALTLSGQIVTIVGIAPPGLKTERAELWLNPRNVVPDMLLNIARDPATMRGAHYLHAIGRLKPIAGAPRHDARVDRCSSWCWRSLCAHSLDGKSSVRSEHNRPRNLCGHRAGACERCVAGMLHTREARYEGGSDGRAAM